MRRLLPWQINTDQRAPGESYFGDDGSGRPVGPHGRGFGFPPGSMAPMPNATVPQPDTGQGGYTTQPQWLAPRGVDPAGLRGLLDQRPARGGLLGGLLGPGSPALGMPAAAPSLGPDDGLSAILRAYGIGGAF